MVKCKECGAPLVNIITGSVCPRGCGGVHPKVPTEENRAANLLLRAEELPECRAFGGLRATSSRAVGFADLLVYVVFGKVGVFRRVARKSAALTCREGNLLARFGASSVYELTPWEEINEGLRTVYVPAEAPSVAQEATEGEGDA